MRWLILTFLLASAVPAWADDAAVLLKLDREFSALSASDGARAAFAAYLAPDAVTVNNSTPEVHGLEAVLAGFDGWPEGAELLWQPVAADIAASGDLGFTRGDWISRVPGEDGAVSESRGRYVSIWKRQADGAWKIILDFGNSSPKAPASE